MGTFTGPDIITDGLLFAYDAGSERCYPGSGTSTTNIESQASPGTLQNGVGFSSANGGFWEFDGVDSKIEVTNFPTQVFNGSCAMECWIYWINDNRSIMLGNFDQGGGGHDINFEKLSSNQLRFYWDRGSRDVTTSGSVVAQNAWQFVTFVRDTSANEFRFYVNGAIVNTTANAGSNITSTGTTFRIGADTRDGDPVLNGNMASVRMYSQALTTAEALQNYNAQKSRFGL
tara:strand:- start:27 stop:716 length:690 start_codon:yes stop_codon:yes gene_type:complete